MGLAETTGLTPTANDNAPVVDGGRGDPDPASMGEDRFYFPSEDPDWAAVWPAESRG